MVRCKSRMFKFPFIRIRCSLPFDSSTTWTFTLLSFLAPIIEGNNFEISKTETETHKENLMTNSLRTCFAQFSSDDSILACKEKKKQLVTRQNFTSCDRRGFCQRAVGKIEPCGGMLWLITLCKHSGSCSCIEWVWGRNTFVRPSGCNDATSVRILSDMIPSELCASALWSLCVFCAVPEKEAQAESKNSELAWLGAHARTFANKQAQFDALNIQWSHADCKFFWCPFICKLHWHLHDHAENNHGSNVCWNTKLKKMRGQCVTGCVTREMWIGNLLNTQKWQGTLACDFSWWANGCTSWWLGKKLKDAFSSPVSEKWETKTSSQTFFQFCWSMSMAVTPGIDAALVHCQFLSFSPFFSGKCLNSSSLSLTSSAGDPGQSSQGASWAETASKGNECQQSGAILRRKQGERQERLSAVQTMEQPRNLMLRGRGNRFCPAQIDWVVAAPDQCLPEGSGFLKGTFASLIALGLGLGLDKILNQHSIFLSFSSSRQSGERFTQHPSKVACSAAAVFHRSSVGVVLWGKLTMLHNICKLQRCGCLGRLCLCCWEKAGKARSKTVTQKMKNDHLEAAAMALWGLGHSALMAGVCNQRLAAAFIHSQLMRGSESDSLCMKKKHEPHVEREGARVGALNDLKTGSGNNPEDFWPCGFLCNNDFATMQVGTMVVQLCLFSCLVDLVDLLKQQKPRKSLNGCFQMTEQDWNPAGPSPIRNPFFTPQPTERAEQPRNKGASSLSADQMHVAK